MFIPIADFWMSGWGSAPSVPDERGSAVLIQGLATDVTIEVTMLLTISESTTVGGGEALNRTNGATAPNVTIGGATVGNRKPGE